MWCILALWLTASFELVAGARGWISSIGNWDPAYQCGKLLDLAGCVLLPLALLSGRNSTPPAIPVMLFLSMVGCFLLLAGAWVEHVGAELFPAHSFQGTAAFDWGWVVFGWACHLPTVAYRGVIFFVAAALLVRQRKWRRALAWHGDRLALVLDQTRLVLTLILFGSALRTVGEMPLFAGRLTGVGASAFIWPRSDLSACFLEGAVAVLLVAALIAVRRRSRLVVWFCVAALLARCGVSIFEAGVQVSNQWSLSRGFLTDLVVLFACIRPLDICAPAIVAAAYSPLLSLADSSDAVCCFACGYNLTGNVSGVCPECGTAVEAVSKA